MLKAQNIKLVLGFAFLTISKFLTTDKFNIL